MKPRRKFRKSKYLYQPEQARSKDKLYHELTLLPGRALMALKMLLDYNEIERGEELLEKLFKDYKNKRKEVKVAVLKSLKFIMRGRYIPDKEYPVTAKLPPKPKRRVLKKTKQLINQIARRVWKTK
jgi:hypothetical protein